MTKKLADKTGTELGPADNAVPDIFSWTANITNLFSNRKKEDLVVLVNNATRFSVVIYDVNRKRFQNIKEQIEVAIRKTMLAMYLNPELVDEYFRQADKFSFVANKDPKRTAWVNTHIRDTLYPLATTINYSQKEIKYDDTFGKKTNRRPLTYGSKDHYEYPIERMRTELEKVTGKPAYKYRAFELLATLDLEIYKAKRRIIVPAEISFFNLHEVLQKIFKWKDYHLYKFETYNSKGKRKDVLVPYEEDLEYCRDAMLMEGHTLSEFFPENKSMIYTYDFGDNWEHEIKFVREIDNYDKESPYLLEAVGQTPPEDV
jgi:hypothetical protein